MSTEENTPLISSDEPPATTAPAELSDKTLDHVVGGAWRPTPAGIILMEP